ncbi:hypothetical protein B0H19DRAFT_17359 [Mycena capillaripes]|nr:hypothetical protein B0H19DRAFT_17359 [Mycena capillaripes]
MSLTLSGPDGDTASTFNRRMDVLFGEDLRDAAGRLKYVAAGKHGMSAVVKYLKTVPWAELQCTIVQPKLDRIIRELEFLCSNSPTSSKPKSKRKSSKPTSDAEDSPQAKRIRSTTDGSVTLDEVPDKDDPDFQPEAGDDPISVHDSSGEESDTTQSKSLSQLEQKKLAKKHVQGPGGKKSRITKQADQRRRKCRSTSPRPDVVGEDGMLVDINVQPIAQPDIRTNPSADVLHFSGKTFYKPSKDGSADKLHRTCTICNKDLVADVSTHRRHYTKFHKSEYHAWCDQNDVESKLEEDVKARQQAQKAEELKQKVLKQQSLDSYLREKPARLAPYTDELLLDAAIQWLIATDQDALTHPKFKEMIDIAARATEGVNLPNSAQTRDAIIKLFHDQMNKLNIRLHSDTVTGMIHITCNAWQASNTDGYYAVTGHWMEETSPGMWVLREALLGFTRMNNAHHGIRLGQTLFKIVERFGIENVLGM